MSQSRTIGDSIKIEFCRRSDVKSIVSQQELGFNIVIGNISNKPVRAYTKLWYNRMPSSLANYDCLLFKKEDTGYAFVDHYSYEPIYPYIIDSLRNIYGDNGADSMINVFDFYKDTLGIKCSDTLSFNLLDNEVWLNAGEYKMQIAFRIGNEYEHNGTAWIRKKINYVFSDWFYFRLEKDLRPLFTN